MNHSIYVSKKLAALRASRSLSLSMLSARTGLSKSTLSEIENGVHANPTKATLNKLADCFGIPVACLIDDRIPVEFLLYMNAPPQYGEMYLEEEEVPYRTGDEPTDDAQLNKLLAQLAAMPEAQRQMLSRFLDFLQENPTFSSDAAGEHTPGADK